MIRVAMHPEIKGGHWVHKKSPPYLPKESCFLCHCAQVISLQRGCPVCGRVTAAHLHPSKLYLPRRNQFLFPLNKGH